MHRDSISNTFIVATLLCLACSLLVSAVATGLRPRQQGNMELFRKSKVLEVAGITPDQIKAGGGVLAVFDKRIQSTIIRLETGQEAVEQAGKAMRTAGKNLGDDVVAKYDQVWAARSQHPAVSQPLPGNKVDDPAGLRFLEQFSHVYMLKSADGQSVESYIFPIRGNGLWGIMMGFISLKPDLQTVDGLTFYAHKETPGLGGEVDNESWKALWEGKFVYDPSGEVALQVIKGPAAPDAPHNIDGLTGATITSNGVTDMVKFWLGPRGFGKYIDQQLPDKDITKGREYIPAQAAGVTKTNATQIDTIVPIGQSSSAPRSMKREGGQNG
jgi:Na+-transporting NADH:ubiquinone oxidoreductase subunit C